MTRRLKVTLLGTGSSGGVPRIGNDWGACDPSDPRNRRLRCSALIDMWIDGSETAQTRVIVDTSPDLREQLLRAEVQYLDAVLFTHDHADQTHGIDDLRALVLRNRRRIPSYMDASTRDSLVPKFRYCFDGQGGYPPILDLQPDISAFKRINILGAGGKLSVLPLRQKHGRIESLGFRIGPVAYCNDADDLPEESFAALEGVHTLIVDALRYTPHPSHAHLARTLQWVERIQPQRAILTNLHIDMDYQTLKRELPEHVEAGYDGMSAEFRLEDED